MFVSRKRHSSRVRNEDEESGERKSRSRRSKHTSGDDDDKKDILNSVSAQVNEPEPPEIKQEPAGEWIIQ